MSDPRGRAERLRAALDMDHLGDALRDLKLQNTAALCDLEPLGQAPERLYTTVVAGYTEDWRREAAWLYLTLLSHKVSIAHYMKMRAGFERALVLGDSVTATEKLEAVETQCGVSTWTLGSRMTLLSLGDTFGPLDAFLSEIRKHDSPGSLLSLFLDAKRLHIEQQANPKIYREVYFRYREECAESALLEDLLLPYIQFAYLPFVSFESFEHRSQLFFSSVSTVVDRYEQTIRVLAERCAGTKTDRDSAWPFIEAFSNSGISSSDYRLQRMESVFKPTPLADFINSTIENLVSLYSIGEYAEVIKRATAILIEEPTAFILYDLVARATVYSGQNAIGPFQANSTGQKVLTLLIEFYSMSRNQNEILLEIQKLAYLLYPCTMSYDLFAFSQNKYDDFSFFSTRLSTFYRRFISSRTGVFLRNSIQKSQFYQKIATDFPETAILWHPHADSASVANPHLRMRCIARQRMQHIKQKEWTRSLELVKPELDIMYTLRLDGTFRWHQLIAEHFRLLHKSGRLNEAASLYCEARYGSPLSAKVIEASLEFTDFFQEGLEYDASDIDIPLMAYFKSEPPHIQYAHVDNFLAANDANSPSLLSRHLVNPTLSPVEKRKIVEFLRYCCSLDILYRSPHFDGNEVVEQERVEICQLLSEHDVENHKDYHAEIGFITQRTAIRKYLQIVHESKVYVDVQRIRTQLVTEIQDSYEQLMVFGDSDVAIIDASKLLAAIEDNDGGKPSLEVLISQSERTDLGLGMFISIFKRVRSEFLFSDKHGLDSYLSVRVRHGTLHGHIRRPFEAHHLACQKDSKTNEYYDEPYWSERFAELPDHHGFLQKTLRNISSKVDDLIARARDHWIRIRTEDSGKKGFLDFSYSDQDLRELRRTFTFASLEIDDFLDQVFIVLWEKAEENLERLQGLIENELKTEILRLLTDADTSLTEYDTLDHFRVPISAIRQCRTEVQREIDILVKWFSRGSDTMIADFSLEQAIATSLNVVERTHTTQHLALERPRLQHLYLDGYLFPSLVDLLCIVYTNVLSHGQEIDEKYTCFLECKEAPGKVWLKHINKAANPQIASTQAKKLLTEGGVRQEGGSGLAKLRKIITTDLGIQSDSISIKTEDQNFVLEFPIPVKEIRNANTSY